MTVRIVTLGLVALTAWACAPRDVGAFWRPGARYALTLRAAGDTAAALTLAVDSIARDTVFGSASGPGRPFPVAFRAVGGDRFVATRQRERWRIRLNPHVADAGLLLSGELSHGRVRGAWETLYTSSQRGAFDVAPAT